jgi:hypothetical protein
VVGQGRPFVDVSVASRGLSELEVGVTAADVAAVVGQGRPSADVSVASRGVSLLGLGATAADLAAVVGQLRTFVDARAEDRGVSELGSKAAAAVTAVVGHVMPSSSASAMGDRLKAPGSKAAAAVTVKERGDRGAQGPTFEAVSAVAAKLTTLSTMKDGRNGAAFGPVKEADAESEPAVDVIGMWADECEREEAKIIDWELVVVSFSDTPEIFLNLSKCKYITKFLKKLGIVIKLRLGRKNAKEEQRSEGSVNEHANC